MGALCIAQGARSVLCDHLEGSGAGAGREVQDGEDICTHKADSQCHRADTNTTCKAAILQLYIYNI